MYLTKAQLKALWFLILVLAISVLIRYLQVYFMEQKVESFSQFDSLFLQYRDSIQAAYHAKKNDDLNYLGNDESESQVKQTISMVQFPININVADKEQLQALPRIGPKMAERILLYRHEKGSFKTKEELMNVKGIGPKTFEKLKNLITIE